MLHDSPLNLASQHYATRLGRVDEMLSSDNKVQPHWLNFIDSLKTMGGVELENRRKENQRLLRENGVTYTVYSDTENFSRPWQLDSVPLLISATEWQSIDQGLQQRAQLLNLILKDLYGAQTLLKKGLLPAELIYAHQGFLLPCVGSLTDSARLTLYATNLVRGPKGEMWVLSDHTQAPSGMGYCLENRNVVGRVMGDLFHDMQVQRLAGFFTTLQETLAQSAPHNKDNPHIVVLTPGALNETYFEHAYLASQMGFTLAQGGDLTMRDGKICLRTLEGLQPVDVLLRRTDDNFCDPLELNANSQLGVAGLLQAVRLGNVSMANPLGSGILENPGLLGFLPSLSRHFLGEELQLPSAATWWCGQKKECDFVIANLSKLSIKSIFRGSTQKVIDGAQLSLAQREELIARIKAKPYLFVGQEHIDFSTAPTLINGAIEPRNCILRSFSVASDQSYQVMPGGLTRVAANKDQFAISNQFGAISKDTWVLCPEQSGVQDTVSSPNLNQAQSQTQSQSNIQSSSPTPSLGQHHPLPAIYEPLASRAADNLFWVGRHMERIFASIRLLNTILDKQSTGSNADEQNNQNLEVLLQAVTHLTGTYPGFISAKPLSPEQRNKEIVSLLRDQHRAGSIASNIEAFFYAAFNIRDLWSQDTWRCIDSIRSDWQQEMQHLTMSPTQLTRPLKYISLQMAAFSGLTAESMTRESGWLLLQLGKKLERSLGLMTLLRSTVVPKKNAAQLHLILEEVLLVTDSLSIYQRRYRTVVSLPLLLELLLGDKTHPYSLLFQLQRLKEIIADLPEHRKNRLSPEQRLILQIHTEIQLCDFNALLCHDEESGVHAKLDALLEHITQLLWEFADMIAQHYFNHVEVAHQLSPIEQEESL